MHLKKYLSKLSYNIGGRRLNYSLRYFHNRKHFPNFDNPRDLSERILSSMLSSDFIQYAKYADKVRVRDYVYSKGLENILLNHYGVWKNPEDIDFSLLPNKFVLKTNNGSGDHIFCKDKFSLNIEETKFLLKKTLNSIKKGNFRYEPHYEAISPLVFCEELLDTESDSLPTDYKFTCINGEPYDIFVATERETSVKYCTFDLDWNLLPYTKKEYMPVKLPIKPKHINEMADIARLLSKDFEFVRVDLYEFGDNIYFSELTFSPWGGLMYSYTNEALKILGDKFIDI